MYMDIEELRRENIILSKYILDILIWKKNYVNTVNECFLGILEDQLKKFDEMEKRHKEDIDGLIKKINEKKTFSLNFSKR